MQQYGEIEGVPVAFTNHALKRMVEMEVPPQEVKKLILNPEAVYTTRAYPDSVCHSYGEHTMVFRLDEETKRYVVITVLYATKAAWMKARRDGKLGDGRENERINVFLPDF